jgi:two-component SAPR family response regulator
VQSGKSTLVVDDDLGVVLWAYRALQNAGHPVLPATSVSVAKELLAEFRPDLALLLIKMSLPGVNDLAISLRGSHPGLRVLAIVDVDREVESPAEGVIVTPQDLNDPDAAATLVRTVNGFLTRRHVA